LGDYLRRVNLLLLEALGSDERVLIARLGISFALILSLFGGWVPVAGRMQNGFQLLTALGKWAQANGISAVLFALFGLGIIFAMSASIALMGRQSRLGVKGRLFYLALGTAVLFGLWLLLWRQTRATLGLVAPAFCIVVALLSFALVLSPARVLRRLLDAGLWASGFCFVALLLWILTRMGGEGGSGLGFWLASLALLACAGVEYAARVQDAYLPGG
jgi:hypothetical protein